MSKGIRAMKLLFATSKSVKCHQCGNDLSATKNLPRLARVGCPQCGSKEFDYDVPPEKAGIVAGVLNVPRAN